ncbi:MAG TPA: hypothetical protein VHM30_20475 [Gemmatimonadaceae bacterium]|nr:hypothetical protein [Gemmatimonadaceae bacterium]
MSRLLGRLLRAIGDTALCAAAALAVARPAAAQGADDRSWKLSGYYLNLYTRSRIVVPPAEAFTLDLNRLRLKLDAHPLRTLGVEVQYDNEALLGSYVSTAQFALTRAAATTSLDLQRDYAAGHQMVARHGLYRALVSWAGPGIDVKVGRQRIPLGTGFFWSPMDLLSPIDPTRLERDYRTGADAVLVERTLGALARVSGIYAPATTRMRAAAAGYLHGNLRGTDFSLLAGRFRGDDAVGADFGTSRGGLGLRGEATATRAATGARFARVLLGADYGFANALDLTVETYYNGAGAAEPKGYDLAGLLAGRVLGLARWYAAVAATYDLTPLVKLAGYGVVNADDGSTVLWPRVEWSARSDLDLVVGVQRFAGPSRSEYGRLSTLVHGEARWFF